MFGHLWMAAAAVCLPPANPPAVPSLDKRVAAIMPSKKDDHWKDAGWRTNLMQARAEAQEKGRPVFLWIMVGNPQGAT